MKFLIDDVLAVSVAIFRDYEHSDAFYTNYIHDADLDKHISKAMIIALHTLWDYENNIELSGRKELNTIKTTEKDQQNASRLRESLDEHIVMAKLRGNGNIHGLLNRTNVVLNEKHTKTLEDINWLLFLPRLATRFGLWKL